MRYVYYAFCSIDLLFVLFNWAYGNNDYNVGGSVTLLTFALVMILSPLLVIIGLIAAAISRGHRLGFVIAAAIAASSPVLFLAWAQIHSPH